MDSNSLSTLSLLAVVFVSGDCGSTEPEIAEWPVMPIGETMMIKTPLGLYPVPILEDNPPAASFGGVQEVSGNDRQGGAPGAGGTPRAGHFRHAQDGDGSQLAGATAPLSSALHTHELLEDQPGGALGRGDRAEGDSARLLSQYPSAGAGDRGIAACLQRNRSCGPRVPIRS